MNVRWSDRVFDPDFVYVQAGRLLGGFGWAGLLLLAVGFAASLLIGRPGVSMLGMLHLPAVWLATLLLLVVAFWSLIGLVLNRALPFLVAQAVVPTGGMFTFLALWSGALWMRAVEGSWWIGDPRQWAELVMIGVYLVVLALPMFYPDRRNADRALVVVGLSGAALVVTVFFVAVGMQSVGSSRGGAVQAEPEMAGPMILVAAGFWCYSTYVCLVRLRCLIKERELGLSETFAVR